MKFRILSETIPTIILNKQWELVNMSFPYADFERHYWKQTLPNGESVLYLQRITLIAKGDPSAHEWETAYILFMQNNPNGHHKQTDEIRISVEEAVRLLGELR